MRGLPLLPVLLAIATVLPLLASTAEGSTATHHPYEPPVSWVIPYPVTAPMVDHANTVFVVARDSPSGPPSLRAYDRTGAQLWSQPLSGTTFSDPGYGGVSYVDSTTNYLHDSRRVVVREGSGALRAYGQANGELAWTRDLGPVPAGFLDAAPVYWGDRYVTWVSVGSHVRLVALDQSTGSTLWESALTWPASSVHPQLGANTWGVYVASRLEDGAMWQLQNDGTVRRSWSSPGFLTSPARLDYGTGDYLYVALANPGAPGTPTHWEIEKRSLDTGVAVWRAVTSETGGIACCDFVPTPIVRAGRVFVVTPNSLLTYSVHDGSHLGTTYSQGQAWSQFPHMSALPMIVRGASGGNPARLESYTDAGELTYALPLDLQAMPAGGAFIGMFGGSVTAVQGLPLRLTDTVPAGALSMFSYHFGKPPAWDPAPGTPILQYDAALQRLTFAPVKSYNPHSVEIQRQASDGAWLFAVSIADPDFGGSGERWWGVASSGSYRAVAHDWLAQSSSYSNVVTVALGAASSGSSSTGPGAGSSTMTATSQAPTSPTHTATGSSSATYSSSPPPLSSSGSSTGPWGGGDSGTGGPGGVDGGGGWGVTFTQTGSASGSFTAAPPPPPAFSATATYTGSASGQTYEAKDGRLTLDTPTTGATLSGTVVLRGRMVDPELLGSSVVVHGIATWGTQSWAFGQARVSADGHWEMQWDTKAAPDGHHLLPDGGYRIAVEGAGSRVEGAYTLANGQWLRTAAANVTFEGPNAGPVWVNATWSGHAGFEPGLVWVVVTGTPSPVRVPARVTAAVDGDAGYRLTLTTSLQVQPMEHEPLDVHLEVEAPEGAGVVTHGLARRPEPGTTVTSRADGSIAWAAPAAGLAVTGMAAAAIASTEAGRYWLVRLLPFALFSRIRGDEAKGHHRREQLLLLVEARPGITYRQLGKEAGLRGGVLAHHVQTLEREGLVRRQRIGAKLHFHPAGPPPAPLRQLPALQASLLRHVQASPGLSQSEAARRMGVSRQALHYHVTNLRQAGLLTVEPRGRETVLAMAPAAAARLWTCPTCRSLMEGGRGPGAACPSCGARPGAGAPAAAG